MFLPTYDPIRVEYQPMGNSGGLTVKMEVLDETGYSDPENYPIEEMWEIPLTNGSIYQSYLSPDADGTWTVRIFVEGRNESVIQQYKVAMIDVEDKTSRPITIL